ncbi:MAG: glucoamylase family protein, partial [Sulfuricaulis sp.]|nr:glucoamylase family protein [Sulfuricaulis sp.]
MLYLRAYFRGNRLASDYAGDEPPLRSELFSADQMEQHGKNLAASHTLTPRRAKDQLLTRLAANERILIEVIQLLTAAVTANRRITPAGEWLLDNFYLIQEQIRTAKRHLPRDYSRELPCLAHGPSAGLPRVYDIALETISHGDGRVDPGSLRRFVAAYQTVTPLKLGELWAIPIMLRLASIENLRRVAAQIAADRTDQNHANRWADQMSDIAERDPKSLILMTADMARSNPPMTTSFVSELARRLQGQSPALALPLTWIEQQLAESGLTIEQLVQSGTQQQAADQVSISNSIGSLRFLGVMDWREFVETMSVVEQTLREDPGGAYGAMDFATRDRYRHVVEKIAKHSRLPEADVARTAIQLTRQPGSIEPGTGDRTTHVGFYLIGKGLTQLEHAAQARLSPAEALRKIQRRFPLILYLGTIALLTAIFTIVFLAQALTGELPNWVLVLIGVVAAVSTSQLAVALVNWLATILAMPQILPRMDFSLGIPPTARTLVVVPTMLVSTQNIDELSEALEVRFLANRDDNLYFGLLTDFQDAHEETLPEDRPLLQRARKNIEALNEKYRGAHGDTFFLFHRPRRWNPQERTWMGYERKRGKLADLNALLRGGAKDRFSLIVGNNEFLSNVKYVITLDTDTQLPRDSARQFVGAMAHPLNRAHYDENKQCVGEGYGILQPRVVVSLPSANRSRYARMQGSESGIDPYTRAVSDIYQDLFGEGSFIGKGIYDVDAFEQALNGSFPENRILSHDLLEGCYARAGLLSDVMLYEEYPARYSADVSRRQRWIRGDWQIARWLLSGVPGFKPRSRLKNPLSLLSQWKLLDNLRRSLAPAALMFLLLLGWTILSSAWFWTLAALGIVLIPCLIASISELFQKPFDMLLSQHLAAVARATGRHFYQAVFTLACLPYEAIFSLEAIVRTLGRMLITHRRLLEWRPADETDRDSDGGLAASFRTMWSAPVIAMSTAVYLGIWKPAVLAVAEPILILWAVSPAIAWWLSRPLVRREAKLTAGQTLFLQKISRKTWAFFETFIGPEDHWLPPDNYQEHPLGMVAHRTSPTNMGLALLANLSAYDFGYIDAGQLIERTLNAFDTMESMERHRGHFYNWYDTQSLKPMHPTYISSVDSGNLAGHLLTLRPGLLALPDQKILGARWVEGLRDTLNVLMEAAGKIKSAALAPLKADIDSACSSRPATLAQARLFLERLAISVAQAAHDIDSEPESQAQLWAQTLARQCQNLLDDSAFLAPWTLLPTAPNGLNDLLGVSEIPTLREVAKLAGELSSTVAQRPDGTITPEQRGWLNESRPLILEASRRAQERIAAIEHLAARSTELAHLEYDFLYDHTRHLLAIGYNVDERRLDASYYDLLASEARFSTFVAIAQGQLPQESWFALGRQLTTAGGAPVLLSWSGSMFEYLMPLLMMPTYESTLLDQTYRTAVESHIEYGGQRGVPWGMSESGYNTTDVRLNYQYRAFGVPGLGLKRGLAEDLVVAPYASALALMVAPEAACLNLQRLAAAGLLGKFGFYEAIDYTPSRVPRGQSGAVIRSFMTHHQGMSLLALAYLLLDRPMQKRFESDPPFQATALLLQERIPKATTVSPQTAQLSALRGAFSEEAMPVRTFNSPNTPIPEVQLLSNGRYHVMITNAGGGYSRWKDLAVTRWREDASGDNGGTFCYLRDVTSGTVWSTAYQPTLKTPKHYEAIFPEGRAEFRRRDSVGDGDIVTHTEIVVSPEDDIELRRVRITNRARTRHTIDVTSYAEVVLATPAAEALHPTFSNLFVQTEIIPPRQAILCTRRPRSREEATPWMFHLMAVHRTGIGEISYETDRMQFIGRGNTSADPQALRESAVLSGSQGSVLDPIVAIRCRITLDPDESAKIDIVSGVGETRDAALSLVEKYHDRRIADRVFDLAWTHNQVTLRQINATEADAQLYGRLANSIVHANASLRADTAVLIKNRRGQSGLWGYAISGDLPIVLLQIKDLANIDLVRQLVQAHAYWRLKGLAVDLAIWNEDHVGYRQLLHEQIMGLIAAGLEANVVDRPGGIFVRPGEQISNEDRILLQTVARVIISDSRGTLAEQINRRGPVEVRVARFTPTRVRRIEPDTTEAKPRNDLLLFNGLGGFTPDGREYVISTAHHQVTPAPWANVLANPQFGTVISESGLGYTWSENAHEFRLTPWHNDPVSDTSGEAFYIRDEERGHFWSPTPLPCRGATPYVTRHGFGYSVFEHVERGIRSELWVYVALDAAVKFAVLKVRNESDRPRRLSATGYVEWVLGDLRSKSAMHVITEIDPSSGALFARNPYNTEFAERTAFFNVDDTTRTVSGDRTEFLGRNATLNNPAAMMRARLSGKVGAALDPCGAIQVSFELATGQEREIRFTLGVGRDAADASKLVNRFRGSAAARAALEKVWQYWNHTLGAVQVETPDKSLNVLTNGWLLYQTLACRLWARSGYYQSGGAFGFRDQLQDAMALVHTEPQRLRAQLLLCASRQFVEGDVQHWWHPPAGRGVRTHCSDDYLWLPLAMCRYVLT